MERAESRDQEGDSTGTLAGDNAAYYLEADSHWNLRRQ